MEVDAGRTNKFMGSEDSKEKTVRDMLACPVCDKLPVAPVYGCQNGHLICESCKVNVQHCSVCRAERFNVRCLLAEELLAMKLIECEHKSSGCSQPIMTGPEYTNHIQNCPYRPIECECKAGIAECRNDLIPYDKYFEHLKDFHVAVESQDRSFLVCCNMSGQFAPRYFQCFDRQFVLMSHRNQTRFWTWVAVMDKHEEGAFYMKVKLRFKVPNDFVQTVPSDVITPSSIRMLPEDVRKSGQCLEFSATSVPTSAPPCVWPQYELEEGEDSTEWGYDVEIWEQRKQINTGKKLTQSPSPTAGRNILGTSPLGTAASSSRQNIPVPIPGLLRVAMAGTSQPMSGQRSNVLHKLLVKPLPGRDMAAGDRAVDDDSDHSYESNDQYSDEGTNQEEGQQSQSESDAPGSRRGSNDTTASRETPDSKISQSHRHRGTHQGRRRSTPSGASDSGDNDGNEPDEGEPGLKRKKYEQLVESEDSVDESENKETATASNPLPKSTGMPDRDSHQTPQERDDIQGIETHRANEIISPDPSPDSVNNPPTPEPVHISSASRSGSGGN